jgi:hypothetical protein
LILVDGRRLMTKQEILKEIESILDSFETQESECLITFSLEKLSSKSKIKKKYSLNRKNQLQSIADQLLKKYVGEEEKINRTPYIQPWPYFIPNNPMQTPWYWDKVICSGSGTAVSIDDCNNTGTGFVKGYNYP